MFEVILVQRADVKEQQTIHVGNDREKAISLSCDAQRVSPLCACYVFEKVSAVTRLLIHHTLNGA